MDNVIMHFSGAFEFNQFTKPISTEQKNQFIIDFYTHQREIIISNRDKNLFDNFDVFPSMVNYTVYTNFAKTCNSDLLFSVSVNIDLFYKLYNSF